MKKIAKLSLVVLLAMNLITSCTKDKETSTPTTIGNSFEVVFPNNDSVKTFTSTPIQETVAFLITANAKIKKLEFVKLDKNNDSIGSIVTFPDFVGKTQASVNIIQSFENISLSKFPIKIIGIITDNNNKTIVKTYTFKLDNSLLPVPEIELSNIIGSELTLAATDVSKNVTFVVNAAAEIKTIVVTQKDKTGNSITLSVTPADYVGTTTYTANFTATGLSAANAPYTISVEVSDKRDYAATRYFSIKYAASVTFTGRYWTGKAMGARNSVAGSFFGATTGMVYVSANQAANKANIDIIFDDISAKALKLYSPSALNTGSVTGYKVTKFGATNLVFTDVTDADMTTITANDANIAIVASGTYAFITEAGKKGLVKVNSITGTGPAASISIDVKIQN